MTHVLTFEKAVRLLERAVAAKGADYVYESPDPAKPEKCVYVTHPDNEPYQWEPSCLVGHVLMWWMDDDGFDEDERARMLQWLDENHSMADDFESLCDFGFFIVEDEAVSLLAVAQVKQDGAAGLQLQRTPWGRAVQEAIEQAKEPKTTGEEW